MADRAEVVAADELVLRRAAGVLAVRLGGVLADAGAVRAAGEAEVDGRARVEAGVKLARPRIPRSRSRASAARTWWSMPVWWSASIWAAVHQARVERSTGTV
ncbi:hypothetical protein ACWCQE_29950 [Streptomyces sp. NPDC002409]